jgi:hypothetical protein
MTNDNLLASKLKSYRGEEILALLGEDDTDTKDLYSPS